MLKHFWRDEEFNRDSMFTASINIIMGLEIHNFRSVSSERGIVKPSGINHRVECQPQHLYAGIMV